MIRAATGEEHKTLCKLASTSKYTSSFSNFMFSGPEAYAKGWIRVYLLDGVPVGLTCVRHKTRSPETTLYYIVVHPEHKGKGIGKALLADLMKQCPNKRIVLNVMNSNSEALAFYLGLGFNEAGPALKGQGVQLIKEW